MVPNDLYFMYIYNLFQNFSAHYWLDEGVPKKKLVMGMPLYGQTFTLRNESDVSLQAPISGPGRAGQFTRAAGFLAYYEVFYLSDSLLFTLVLALKADSLKLRFRFLSRDIIFEYFSNISDQTKLFENPLLPFGIKCKI